MPDKSKKKPAKTGAPGPGKEEPPPDARDKTLPSPPNPPHPPRGDEKVPRGECVWGWGGEIAKKNKRKE